MLETWTFNGRVFNLDIVTLEKHKIKLENFCKDAGRNNIISNCSLENMKFNAWPDQQLWIGAFHDTRLIHISSVHPFEEYKQDYWRILSRRCTLPNYSSVGGNFSKKFTHDIGVGKSMPYQVDHAIKHGAKKIVVTTTLNHADANSSVQQGRVLYIISKWYPHIWSHIDTIKIYGVSQMVWELKIKNLTTGEKIIYGV